MIGRQEYRNFLNGDCSSDEQALIAAYLQAHPDLLESLIDEEVWNHFETTSTLAQQQTERLHQRSVKSIFSRSRVNVFLRFAIAASIICGVFWLASHLSSVAEPEKGFSPFAANSLYLVSNKSPRMQLITLKDGSCVTLSPASEIKFKDSFIDVYRDVRMKGTACFEVAKDKVHPFRVHTGASITTALGTSFTISESKNLKSIAVKLHEGSVRLQTICAGGTTNMEKVMKPGDELIIAQLRIHSTFKPAAKKSAKPVNDETKFSGELSFKNASLPLVLVQLGKTFNQQIRFEAASLASIRITGNFHHNESLASILEIICTLNALKLTHGKEGFELSR